MKTYIVSLRALLFFTLLTGIIYPTLITVFAQSFFPYQANGSMGLNGSELIAQEFRSPHYFWPRPSAIGYNPLPSGGSNLGPTSKILQKQWMERRDAGFSAEMLATSASGLDPHISPQAALTQVLRVAQARHLEESVVRALVIKLTQEKQWGFLGERRVNVLLLNRQLDEWMPVASSSK